MKLLQIKPLFLLIFVHTLFSQINTEAMRNNDTIIGLQNKLQLAFSYISGSSEFIILNAHYRLDYHSQSSWHVFLITKYDRAFEKSQADFTNRGFGHVRFINSMKNQIEIEGFVQKEFNHFLDLKNRELFGGGYRFNPFKQFFLGIGAMNEVEIYEYSKKQSFLKSTNYINYTASIFDNISLQNIVYYQFKIQNINHYRILWDGKVNFQGNDWLSFNINFKYRYDMSNLHPKGDSYFEITNGLGFRF